MLWVYRFLVLPGLLLALLLRLRRMVQRGGLGENLGNRFGIIKDLPPRRPGVKRVWVQAVSVGELLAMAPVLERLRRSGAVEVYLTTTTTTGYAVARERFAGQIIGLGYFPIDFWIWSARAWRTIAPDVALLVEGERWPEHLYQARRRGVPVVCVNARISDRGFRRSQRIRWIARRLWRGIHRILASSPLDAERFRALGFSPDVVQVTGSIKLDVEIPRVSPERLAALRQELGLPDGLIIVGGSTWPGEEEALVGLLTRAREGGVRCRLLLVPRHAERRAEIRATLANTGLTFHLRSEGVPPGPVDVMVGDTTGELRVFAQLADLFFAGRSLPPYHEGQTPIEAAVLERPMLFGPGMSNFRDVAAGLLAHGAAVVVRDAAELRAVGYELLCDAEKRQRLADACGQWTQASRGAVERSCVAIEELLSESPGLTLNARSE